MQDYPKSSADFTKAEIAGRYLCQQAVSGTSATVGQCLEKARLLRLAGEDQNQGPQLNTSEELVQYARKLGTFKQNSIAKTAVNLANLIITDIRRGKYEPSKITDYLAPEKRKTLWQKLHVLPGGANAEINFAQKNCSANSDTFQNLLLFIRLGIINHYNGHLGLDITKELLADYSSESTNNWEPLVAAKKLVTGEVRGIIINIDGSKADTTPKSELQLLAQKLARDNIVIKDISSGNLGKVIESTVKTANELDIDTGQLPLIIRILGYPKDKAIADYSTFLAFGWSIHISPISEITASPVVIKNINDIFDNLSLGKIMASSDLQKTLRLYKDHVEKRRASLGLS